ncbi:MAG TPA: zinc-ribbon domain-containing protein, partial [Cellvibrionaceae bacterium]|nr:zinc-ribbon domain-containing protein [Cellvibrionaceae bacterium]
MADMITRCPQCATAFRITAAHLKLAQGSVRCGACFTIFNALENLSERSTSNAPASNLADDFLISDHMGIEDESSETSAEASTKSSLFERVEQAKAQPEKSEEADESWAIALLSEEGLAEVHASDDEFLEEEPSFRPFSPGPS